MPKLLYHENLSTLHVGTLPNHAYFIPHASRESALTRRRENSERFKLLSGEWDFIDVWKNLQPAQLPPVPVRTANGGAGAMNIGGMNDQQFSKLNEMLKRGAKVDMRY